MDIGAHDGITFSNTYIFEQLGWRGICIEPNPAIFPQLKKNRYCEVSDKAICEIDGSVNFIQVGHPGGKGEYTEMLSGIANKYDIKHMSRVIKESAQQGVQMKNLKIDGARFNSVVSEKNIDYLSIDVEGSELDIISVIPFDQYNIKVISIENNFRDAAINDVLISAGFKLCNIMDADYIFCK
ncbi:MAG: FkbM family methyltransferase [Chloroflexia bacterium]|nr:FkbM family methyltransferase [Chloroflexia bacterium]